MCRIDENCPYEERIVEQAPCGDLVEARICLACESMNECPITGDSF